MPPGKERVTICLDRHVLNYFRQAESGGSRNYQALINSALRDYISAQDVSIEMITDRILDEAYARMKIKQAQAEMEKLRALEKWINSPGSISDRSSKE
jgi:hypothetical protein